jgi:hypothetical protein
MEGRNEEQAEGTKDIFMVEPVEKDSKPKRSSTSSIRGEAMTSSNASLGA